MRRGRGEGEEEKEGLTQLFWLEDISTKREYPIMGYDG